MNESQLKSKIVKVIKENHLGYARRFEDQYAVGIPDMVIIPEDGDTWFIEAKVTRTKGEAWGPTPRQEIELNRIIAAGGNASVMCFCKETQYLTIVNWKNKMQVDEPFDPRNVTKMLRTLEND